MVFFRSLLDWCIFPSIYFSAGWDIAWAYGHTIRSMIWLYAYVAILHFRSFDPTAHIQLRIDAI